MTNTHGGKLALTIDPHHTALLAMDFENDIVHEEGALKDFGFAQMVKDNDVLGKTARLLAVSSCWVSSPEAMRNTMSPFRQP